LPASGVTALFGIFIVGPPFVDCQSQNDVATALSPKTGSENFQILPKFPVRIGPWHL